jgi:nucleotide-binding universal stress UspA family protein
MFELILVPLDGSKRSEQILAYVEALAECVGSEVVLMQVVEPVLLPYDPQGYLPELDTERTSNRRKEATDYLEGIAVQLRHKGYNVRTRIEEGSVIEAILQVCQLEKPRLIALASHGRTGLARAFYGSVTDGILHQCTCPMLVVRSV